MSGEVEEELFCCVGMKLKVGYGLKMKNWRGRFKGYGKGRKRMERNLCEVCDELMVLGKYGKERGGVFRGMMGKMRGFRVLEYINYVKKRGIGRVKYGVN